MKGILWRRLREAELGCRPASETPRPSNGPSRAISRRGDGEDLAIPGPTSTSASPRGQVDGGFSQAGEDKKNDGAERNRALSGSGSQGPAVILPALAWLSLVGLHPCRAPLRFARQPSSYFPRRLSAPNRQLGHRNGKPSCAKLDCQKRALGTKTGRTRSSAPATARRRWAHDHARNDDLTFDRSSTTAILSTEERAHPFTCRF